MDLVLEALPPRVLDREREDEDYRYVTLGE
jgi:hypothetical protein